MVGNFHLKILGVVAMSLALLIQYAFISVWKINDIGDLNMKLGISMFVPIKYFLMGLFALLLPEGKYFLGAYIFSMITGYIFLKIGVRNSLNKK